MNWVCFGLNLILMGVIIYLLVQAIRRGEVTLNLLSYKRTIHPVGYWFGVGVGLLFVVLLAMDCLRRLNLP